MADLRIEPQDLPDGPLLPGGIRPGPGTGHTPADVGVVEGAAGDLDALRIETLTAYAADIRGGEYVGEGDWWRARAELLAEGVLALVADREALLERNKELEQLLGGSAAACSGGGSE